MGLLLATSLICAAPLSAQPTADGKAAAAWLGRNAAPLSTTDPDAPTADLAKVAAMVGDARILGAGEATHGTREFFRFKDRLFRFLVQNKGFTAFAIEANYADALAINAYVQGGPGDPEALIAALNYWTWDTEEVLALIEWMRAYNAANGNRLSFYAFDIQYAPTNFRIAADYLDRTGIDTGRWRTLFADYLRSATDIAAGYRATNSYSAERMSELSKGAAELALYFDRHRNELMAKSDAAQFHQARMGALAFAWYFVMQARPEAWRFTNFHNEYDVRDRAMADLAEAALDSEGPSGKLYVWAHNAHISKEKALDERLTMGHFLADNPANRYVSLGFAFDRGGFQAFPPRDPKLPGQKPQLSSMKVGPRPAGSAEAVLRRGPGPMWVADLRKLDPGTAAYRWFSDPHPLFWTGSTYSVELEAKHPAISLVASHDLLVFIAETKRARPLPNTLAKQGIQKDW